MNDISIIVVSWNCWGYLDHCLKSLLDQVIRCAARIVVVDNGSTDGTAALLKAGYPSVTLVENRENLGFAAANNQGLRSPGSSYVLLLNPDTLVHGGALDALHAFLQEHQDAWAVGPALLNGDNTPQESGVRFPSTWDILCEALFLDRLFPKSRIFGRHKELFEEGSKPRVVDYVPGACLMVRREAIEKVGLLDEQFFMYFEEVDWCYRMARAGGRVYYCPDAKVVHYGGGELGHFDERRILHYHRSLLLFYRKHYSPADLLGLRCVLILRSLVRILTWTLAGAAKPALRTSAVSGVRGYARALGVVIRG